MLIETYAPARTKDILGNTKAIEDTRTWIKNWKHGALILYGPVGIGKSLAIRLIAKELKLELIESNANEVRGYKAIKETILKATAQRSLFYSGKLIVIDELDALDSTRGISELIKNTSHPVVLIAQDPYLQKLANLRKTCKLVKFIKVRYTEIEKFLEEICKKENIVYDRKALNQLAKISDGDVRAALTDLESLLELTQETITSLGFREKKEDIFNTLKIIFKTESIENVRIALDNSEKSPEDLFLWMSENIISEYENLEDVAGAYDYLSKADIFRARIMKRQAMSLYKYFIEISFYGVALSKKEPSKKFVMYKFPMLYFRKDELDSVKEKIAQKLHISKKEAGEYIPLIKIKLEKVKKEFGFDEDEIELVKSAKQ